MCVWWNLATAPAHHATTTSPQRHTPRHATPHHALATPPPSLTSRPSECHSPTHSRSTSSAITTTTMFWRHGNITVVPPEFLLCHGLQKLSPGTYLSLCRYTPGHHTPHYIPSYRRFLSYPTHARKPTPVISTSFRIHTYIRTHSQLQFRHHLRVTTMSRHNHSGYPASACTSVR